MTRHPARFSKVLLPTLAGFLRPGWSVLDPFAGVGGVHELQYLAGVVTTGIELEPEWAAQHPQTQVGNALSLPFCDHSFDAIVTSPVYGNRMSDHHEAKDDSRRLTYRHTLGRPLTKDNSGSLQWGPDYRRFHLAAWIEAVRVLKPGGLFVLNIADHVRKGEVQRVSQWHWQALRARGLETVAVRKVRTPGMRFGQNGNVRVGHEFVIAMRKAA